MPSTPGFLSSSPLTLRPHPASRAKSFRPVSCPSLTTPQALSTPPPPPPPAPRRRLRTAFRAASPSRFRVSPGTKVSPATAPAPIVVQPVAPSPRKPHGHWNEVANIEAALLEVNALLPGRRGRKVMPTTAEMRGLGRTDLISALAKHRGIKAVAEVLGWSCERGRGKKKDGRQRRRPRALTEDEGFVTMMAPGMAGQLLRHAERTRLSGGGVKLRGRVPTMRRPKYYWDDFEKVKSSISAFVDEYGVPGVMPTGKEFRNAGQGALTQAAQRHGGLVKVAALMGLKSRKAAKVRNTWSDKRYFVKMLRKFVDENDPGVMPTASELKAAGMSPLANAVTVHGGYPAVAQDLGLIVRNARREGAPELWDRERLAEQLRTFTATFYPSLAVDNRMPSESQLRRCGRNDLCYAISKWGGYKKVQEDLGLSPKPVGPRRRS